MSSLPRSCTHRPAPVARSRVALAEQPPGTDRGPVQVRLQPDNLVAVCDEIGAQTFSMVGAEVTFLVRGPGVVLRWRGWLGQYGVIPV